MADTRIKFKVSTRHCLGTAERPAQWTFVHLSTRLAIFAQCEISSGAVLFACKMELLKFNEDFLRIKKEDYATAIAKYDMTDKMVRESMETIRQWYKMQHHLPEEGLPDDRLFRHLLAVGFSLEKAKRMIDNMLTSRTLIPEAMTRRDPCAEWALVLRRQVLWAVVPQRLEDMTRITICGFTGVEVPGADTWAFYKYAFMLGDYRMCTDISLGEHFVVDFKDLRLAHVVRVTPTMIKKTLFIIQNCFGAKIKGIYFVNVPQFVEAVLSLFKAGLSKKAADRLHIYKDYESLHKDLPKKVLPADMGGLNKTLQELTDDTYAAVSEPKWHEWFLAQDSITTDESRRVGLDKDVSSVLLGMHGSFRKLDLD